MNVPLSSDVRYVAPSLASHTSSGLPEPAPDFGAPFSRLSAFMELPGSDPMVSGPRSRPQVPQLLHGRYGTGRPGAKLCVG